MIMGSQNGFLRTVHGDSLVRKATAAYPYGSRRIPMPGKGCDLLPRLILWPFALSSQRDLDFTVDLDFKGQLCETSVSNDYKMR